MSDDTKSGRPYTRTPEERERLTGDAWYDEFVAYDGVWAPAVNAALRGDLGPIFGMFLDGWVEPPPRVRVALQKARARLEQRLVAQGKFPAPFYMTERRPAWTEVQLDQWLSELEAASASGKNAAVQRVRREAARTAALKREHAKHASAAE